jgi:hypothetical protein
MIVYPAVIDGGLQRRAYPGDVISAAELINSTLTTVGAGTILAAQVVSGIINRTGPTGAFTDTTDTSQNIISAMIGNYNYNTSSVTGVSNGNGAQIGTTFRLSYINSVAFAMTLAAGTGVTLGSNVNIAASSVKDYLFTITNGTPQQVFAATTTNGSAIVTGMNLFQTSQLSVGMLVTGTGVSGNIISIQPGTGVTLSANASATGTNVAITFNPTLRIDSLGQKLL